MQIPPRLLPAFFLVHVTEEPMKIRSGAFFEFCVPIFFILLPLHFPLARSPRLARGTGSLVFPIGGVRFLRKFYRPLRQLPWMRFSFFPEVPLFFFSIEHSHFPPFLYEI